MFVVYGSPSQTECCNVAELVLIRYRAKQLLKVQSLEQQAPARVSLDATEERQTEEPAPAAAEDPVTPAAAQEGHEHEVELSDFAASPSTHAEQPQAGSSYAHISLRVTQPSK